MEKVIAGKMLLCLRSSSKVTKEDDLNPVMSPPLNLHLPTHKDVENDISATNRITEDTISFNVGYSFTQYLAQCVDNLRGISIDDFEEHNYNILKSKREGNSHR